MKNSKNKKKEKVKIAFLNRTNNDRWVGGTCRPTIHGRRERGTTLRGPSLLAGVGGRPSVNEQKLPTPHWRGIPSGRY